MSKTWKQYSEEQGVELNDQYFLIYCGNNDRTSECMKQLHSQYGFKGIPVGAGSLPRGPWFYANINTRFMFTGTIGVNTLSGPVIGNHALTMDDFLEILDIYERYKGYGLLKFPDEQITG